MGEYVSYNGDHVKMGTCENLYYYTYDELERLLPKCAELSGNLKPMAYLDPRNGFRYRFPFPSDRLNSDPDFDFDKGELVHVPPECQNDEHLTIWVSLHPRSTNAYNINAEVDCPMSPTRTGRYSTGSNYHLAEIVQQKQVDGQLWTVLRCPYCHAAWRLPPEAAAGLVNDLLAEGTDLAADLATEIFYGYIRQL